MMLNVYGIGMRIKVKEIIGYN